MSKDQDTALSAKVNRPTFPASFDADYARAMRDLRYPLECNSGPLCWRAMGSAACGPTDGMGSGRALFCKGCNGKIRR